MAHADNRRHGDGETGGGPFDLLPAAVFSVDRSGGLVSWNAEAERLWGRRPAVGEREDWAGWRWPDGSAIAAGDGPVARALDGGSLRSATEIGRADGDGGLVPHLLRLAPAGDGALALLVELPPRPESDLAQERLAAIVSSSDDAIIGKTLDGIITSWNEGATRMYGYRPEEMIGKPVALLMPEEKRDEEDGILARLRQGERIGHFDTVRVTRDGRRIDVSLAISPVRDASGRIVGASKVARDISERKRAEALQRVLSDELNHRVKNALATIQAIASQSLRRSADPASFVASFNGRVQALARAHDLLVADEFRGTSVADLVREEVLLDAADPRVRVTGPDVRLDPRTAVQVALVLHELATNARKYGALALPGGRLAIEWSVVVGSERRLVLSWHESGVPGIRAPAVRGRGFGTTLIERSLGTAGGSARLTYGSDGIAWALEMPLADEAKAAAAEAMTPAPDVRQAPPPAVPAVAGLRVLVVEDEPLVAMDVESSLAGAGCTVVGPAPSVARALALVASEGLDAAILDANLAGSAVDPVADALAARGVPFAFATGYGREALPARHAAAPVLRKPVLPARLLEVVATLTAPPDR